MTIFPAPHSLHAASPEMILAGHKLAKELNTKYHVHVAEEPFEVKDIIKKYRMHPVEFLKGNKRQGKSNNNLKRGTKRK